MSPVIKDFVKKVPGLKPALDAIRRRAARVLYRRRGGLCYAKRVYAPELEKALQDSAVQSDISDHLGQLFFVTASASPTLIVELGTRQGEEHSRASRRCGSRRCETC